MKKTSLLEALKKPKMWLLLFMGFSSGLPLLLVGGTLQAWLTDEKVSLTIIGLLSLVGLPYTIKFLWAPLMDRYAPIPGLGRRKSWMFLTQISLALSIYWLSISHPEGLAQIPPLSEKVPNAWSQFQLLLTMNWQFAASAFLVSFCSASQDIVLDAWRRDALSDEELGMGSSTFVTGYLLSMRLVAGALALTLADHMPWPIVYQIMAALIGIGVITTIIAKEPALTNSIPKTLKESVVDPFKNFIAQPGAWLMLAFILLYKLGDNIALHMTMPYYQGMGFTKTEIAAVTKVFGWAAITFGSLMGGVFILRLTLYRALYLFGVLQIVAILSFILLSFTNKSIPALMFVIGFENLVIGLGTVAYMTFMASITNKRYSATQYALLSSLMGVPRVIISAPAGWLSNSVGWPLFFVICAIIAIPGMLLIPKLKKYVQMHDTQAVLEKKT